MAMAISTNKYQLISKKIIYAQNSIKIIKICLILIASYLILSVARYWTADLLYAKGGLPGTRLAIIFSPNEAVYHIQLARLYTESKDLPLADFEAKKVLSLSPRNVKLLKELSNVYSDLAQNNKAFLVSENELLLKLTGLAPTDAYVYYQLSLSYAKLGKIDSAKQTLTKTLELKSDYDLAQKLYQFLF
jgi:predicted Zn-dependent protease